MLRQRKTTPWRLLLALILLSCPTPTPAADWVPTETIEWIVMGPRGGRVDRVARALARVVDDGRMAPQPVTISNQGTGLAADTLRQLKNRQGDPHLIVLTSAAYLTTPLRDPALAVDIQSFTPIVGLAADSLQLWVRHDRPEKSLGKLAATLFDTAADPLPVGMRSNDDEDGLALAAIEKGAGMNLAPVRYKSSLGAPKDLARGLIEAVIASPGEAGGFWDLERARPLVNFSPVSPFGAERPPVPGFTVAERAAALLALPRAVVAPARISVDAQRFYESLFETAADTEAWRRHLADNRLVADRSTGLDLTKKLVAAREAYRKLLKDLGEID